MNVVMMVMNGGLRDVLGRASIIENCEMYKANSGAIRFRVRFPSGTGFGYIALTNKTFPLKDLYQLILGPFCKFSDMTKTCEERKLFRLPQPIDTQFKEFWLTWYNGIIRLGLDGQEEPFFTYADDNITNNSIACVKFGAARQQIVEWLFDSSPVICNEVDYKDFDDGKFTWVEMASGEVMPLDALIGGFENEPIYISRALHNGSLCPGKYVPSKQATYVAWGGREHAKNTFEILCGYNGKWVKTRDNYIPPNAFIGGTSEVRQEPLYIGRAMIDNNLINGKVHVLYGTCYLPYQGKEVEKQSYEILVSAHVNARAILPDPNQTS